MKYYKFKKEEIDTIKECIKIRMVNINWEFKFPSGNKDCKVLKKEMDNIRKALKSIADQDGEV